MNPLVRIALIAALAVACGPRYRLVYSSGFSFAKYDFMVVAKPEVGSTSTPLLGMDIEFGNLMARHNMRIIGDKEFERLPEKDQSRTLLARLALITSPGRNLITVSFDDAVSGRTVASISQVAKGDMLDEDERTKALESVTNVVVQAIQKDKGLTIASGT
jgi:hypothetical protein